MKQNQEKKATVHSIKGHEALNTKRRKGDQQNESDKPVAQPAADIALPTREQKAAPMTHLFGETHDCATHEADEKDLPAYLRRTG